MRRSDLRPYQRTALRLTDEGHRDEEPQAPEEDPDEGGDHDREHPPDHAVEKKITEDTEEAGRTVRASKDDPQYLVKSEKSGGEAVHKPGALTKD